MTQQIDQPHRSFGRILQVFRNSEFDDGEFLLGLSMDEQPIILNHSMAYGRAEDRKPATIHIRRNYSTIAELLSAQFLARDHPVMVARSVGIERILSRCTGSERADELLHEHAHFDRANGELLRQHNERLLIILQGQQYRHSPPATDERFAYMRLLQRPNTLCLVMTDNVEFAESTLGPFSLILNHRSGELYRYRKARDAGFRIDDSQLVLGPPPP